MSDLVGVAEWLAIPGNEGVDPVVAGVLLDDVEAMLESALNRTDHPFQVGESDREEVQDGTGTKVLYLDYPISDLTSLTLGYDPDVPDETLDVSDRGVLVWREGSNRVVRVDGGTFGTLGRAEYVRIEYDTADDLPDLAAKAVKDGATSLHHRGAEASAIASERLGAWSVEYSTVAAGNPNQLSGLPSWQAAIGALRKIPV